MIATESETIDLNQYMNRAIRTLKPGKPLHVLIHCSLGIAGEVGELFMAIDKMDKVNVREEMGDIMWYLAVACKTAELDMNVLYMESDTYMEQSSSTGMQNLIMGMANFVDHIKRAEFYTKEVETAHIGMASLALLSGLRMMSHSYGFSFADITRRNIAKLAVRYPDKFTELNATERNLDAEYDILSKA